MDLVTDFSELTGYLAMDMLVNRLTNIAHLAPCDTEVTVAEYVKLFIDTIFRLYGMREEIISDRDPRSV